MPNGLLTVCAFSVVNYNIYFEVDSEQFICNGMTHVLLEVHALIGPDGAPNRTCAAHWYPVVLPSMTVVCPEPVAP
jgi:hypothetical protein